jgi:hypothetical protein
MSVSYVAENLFSCPDVIKVGEDIELAELPLAFPSDGRLASLIL